MKYEIRIAKTNGDTPVKARASVLLDDCFVATGFKVIEGRNGLFVAAPSRKTKDDKHRDITYPATREFRDELYGAILDAYDNL